MRTFQLVYIHFILRFGFIKIRFKVNNIIFKDNWIWDELKGSMFFHLFKVYKLKCNFVVHRQSRVFLIHEMDWVRNTTNISHLWEFSISSIDVSLNNTATFQSFHWIGYYTSCLLNSHIHTYLLFYNYMRLSIECT